ncbi:MAG: hypothetical protein RKK15_03975 [Defluviicoccus sp.]|nr:hypothetical protein [Defluviicoccus sp.]
MLDHFSGDGSRADHFDFVARRLLVRADVAQDLSQVGNVGLAALNHNESFSPVGGGNLRQKEHGEGKDERDGADDDAFSSSDNSDQLTNVIRLLGSKNPRICWCYILSFHLHAARLPLIGRPSGPVGDEEIVPPVRPEHELAGRHHLPIMIWMAAAGQSEASAAGHGVVFLALLIRSCDEG